MHATSLLLKVIWVGIGKFNFIQVLHLCGMASVPKFNGTPLNFKATAKVKCSENWMFWYRNPNKLLVRSSRSFRHTYFVPKTDQNYFVPDFPVNKPCISAWESLHTSSATDFTITQENPFAVLNLPKFLVKSKFINLGVALKFRICENALAARNIFLLLGFKIFYFGIKFLVEFFSKN